MLPRPPLSYGAVDHLHRPFAQGVGGVNSVFEPSSSRIRWSLQTAPGDRNPLR